MLKFWLGSRVPRRVRQSQMIATAQVLTLERRELLDGQTGSGSNNPYGSAPPSGPPHGSGTITVSKNQDPTLNTLAGNKTESSASGGTYQKVQKLYTNALFDVDVVPTLGSNTLPTMGTASGLGWNKELLPDRELLSAWGADRWLA